MATLATSWPQVHPSRIEPGVIMQVNQVSGYMRLLAEGRPRVLISPEDLYVYIRTLGVTGQVQIGQTAGNLLPGATLTPRYIQAPTYRVRSHAEWDHHDAANMERWGINIAEGYRLANRQSIFQALRNMALYGVNAANGEGFLNAGGTAVTLPPDSFGHTSVSTYDNGQMGLFLLQTIVNLKSLTYQMGIPHRFVFLGPQRIIARLQAVMVVQITSYQRLGAGSATVGEMVKEVMKETEGDAIEFAYDDTLIDQGVGGTSDMVVLQMPEVKQPSGPLWDTNEFARLEPNLAGCAFQYADMDAPLEVTAPLALGALDTLYEIRGTCGWPVRPETTTLISMPY